MDLWHVETLFLIAAIFVLAGFVKGVVGLGLPTVSLGLLTATLGLKEAMALVLIPAFAANVWQGAVGGNFGAAVRRLWTLLAAVCVGTWAGASLLARSDAALLSGVLGLLVCAYAVIVLTTPNVPSPGRSEGWLSPAIGATSVAALAPALLGTGLGQRVRRTISERHFRRVFLCALLALGAYIAAEAFPWPGA